MSGKVCLSAMSLTALLFALVLTALHPGYGETSCDPLRDLHLSSICQLTLGMTPAQVLSTMKRPPDMGEEQGGDIVSGWKLQGGSLLVVRFRKKQYVSELSLEFHPLARAVDLGLPTAFEDQYASGGAGAIGLAGRSYPANSGSQLKDNPKLRPTYHRDETQNSEHVIWYREEGAEGYKREIGFLSASRLKAGERVYQNDVATKYVTVRKPELEKFDRAVGNANSAETKP